MDHDRSLPSPSVATKMLLTASGIAGFVFGSAATQADRGSPWANIAFSAAIVAVVLLAGAVRVYVVHVRSVWCRLDVRWLLTLRHRELLAQQEGVRNIKRHDQPHLELQSRVESVLSVLRQARADTDGTGWERDIGEMIKYGERLTVAHEAESMLAAENYVFACYDLSNKIITALFPGLGSGVS